MSNPVCVVAKRDAEHRLPGVQAHVDRCLPCQANLARRRRLRRHLRSLRNTPEVAPPQIIAAVERRTRAPEAVPGGAGEGGVIPQIAAAGAVAATAAGAAFVMVWRRSHPAI